MKYLYSIVILLITQIIRNEAASCTDYSDETTCDNNNLCTWNLNNNDCECSSAVIQEIMFVMDGSRSVDQEGWDLEVEFVREMVQTGVEENSYIGVIVFGSGAWTQWTFADSQDRDDIDDLVANLEWVTGATWMESALELAISDFSTYESTTEDYPNLLMLITDGNPKPSRTQRVCDSGNPMKDNLDAAGITVVVIGVGTDWDEDEIDCLVDDPDSQIIYVDDFDSFDLVRQYTDDFLCPATISLRLTEVRVQDSSTDPITDAKFIELYNTGVDINPAVNSLKFSGMVTGEITEATISNISSSRYIVFYDPAYDRPNCTYCDACTDTNSDDLCDNGIYIPCDGTECSFASGYDNDNWELTILDGSDDSVIVNVTVNRNPLSWPGVTDGWSFELTDKSLSDYDGSNWAMSCRQQGTPGDAPIEKCTGDCTVSQCQENGDKNATCEIGLNATCICTTDNNFYQSGPSCFELTDPGECNTYTYKEQDIDDVTDYYQTVEIRWDDVDVDIDYFYDLVFEDETGELSSATPGESVYYMYVDYTNRYTSTTDPVPKVRVVADDDGTYLYGSYVNCPITTSEPTTAPTLAPTFALPPIDNCTALVYPQSQTIYVSWPKADTNAPDTDSSVNGYKLFWVEQSGADESPDVDSTQLYYEFTLDNAISGDFDSDDLVINVSAIVYDSVGAEDTDRMKDGATECTLLTPAPTNAPSAKPTIAPSARPTGKPSAQPTSAPTYEDWRLYDCTGNIEQGGESLSLSWSQNSPASDHTRTVYLRRTTEGGSEYNRVFLTSDNTVTSISDKNIDDLLITDTFYIYPLADDFPGDNEESEQNGTYCDVGTYSPTAAPTDVPSMTPTSAPTGRPTSEPSNNPTNQPTPAPTYLPVSIDDCTFELSQGDTRFTASFTEPDFDETGLTTPTSDTAQYLFEWVNDNGEADFDFATAGSANAAYSAIITSSDGFDFQEGLNVTVYFETSKAAGDAAACIGTTQQPSPSPTTAAPTPAPTYADPEVYIDIDSIESDPECTGSTADGYICYLTESLTSTSIDALRTPISFGHDVIYDWEITFEGEDTQRRRLYGSSLGLNMNGILNHVKKAKKKTNRDLLQTSDDQGEDSDTDGLADSDDFSGATSGSVTVDAYDGDDTKYSGSASFHLIVETTGEDESTESFYFTLTGCSISPNETDTAKDYTCSVVEPSSVQIFVTDSGDNLETTTKEGDLPDWIWYPIAAGVVLMPILGFLGWRLYNKKKLADAMEQQKKAELQQAEALDDLGNFGEIGDAVQFNPLATGGTADIATGGDYIDAQLEAQKKNFEVAHVDIETNVFRQDFGPVQTNQRV